MSKLVSFTLPAFTAALAALVKLAARTTKSIGDVALMAAFAANHGFHDAAGVGVPTAAAVNSLFQALPKSVSKAALVAIFEEHCNLAYASGTWVLFDAGKEWTPESVKALRAIFAEWESYKPATKAAATADVFADFQKLVDSLTHKAAKGKPVANLRHLPALQAALVAMKATIAEEETVSA